MQLRVSLAFARLPDKELDNFTLGVKDGMTGNGAYPTPPVTMVNLYHDTMPKSTDAITWPEAPIVLRDIAGNDPDAFLDELIKGGYMLVGNPEEVS